MRLGAAYDPAICPYYRAVFPLQAMAERGHEVLWPDARRVLDIERLRTCDVVHFYRLAGPETERAVAALTRSGTPIVYDNDDNRGSQVVAEAKGNPKAGLPGHRVHASTVRIARLGRVFTTTTEVLAEIYRRAGLERVEVIENALEREPRPRRSRHRGLVIGWMAAPVHQIDAERLGIDDVLRRLIEKHDNVRVESIGVDLRLDSRYRHDSWVAFNELPARIAGFDIGIAPLANTPVNRARSDVKLKEYAAAGIPWLASPVGGYVGLGEAQGGRLVADGDWLDALDALVSNRRERRRLGRRARKWAQSKTIDCVADQWEAVFTEAVA